MERALNTPPRAPPITGWQGNVRKGGGKGINYERHIIIICNNDCVCNRYDNWKEQGKMEGRNSSG